MYKLKFMCINLIEYHFQLFLIIITIFKEFDTRLLILLVHFRVSSYLLTTLLVCMYWLIVSDINYMYMLQFKKSINKYMYNV